MRQDGQTEASWYVYTCSPLKHGSSNDVSEMQLDTGRHFYPPDFFIEICSYVSFFKQNTIQIHLSDNINNYPERYTHDRTFSLYGSFRLWSDDPAVAGLNTRQKVSFTRQ